MLVGRDAHSACNHCASLLSLRFSRQPLFSMDTRWTLLVSPPNRAANSLVLPSGFPSPPENLSLCCCRVGPPPQFEPSIDRRMEWSPVWQQSTSVWDLQWICVSCSRTVPAGDIPSCRQVPCGVCGDPSQMVVDFRSNERWNWCTRCQTRVESSPQEVRRTCQSGSIVRVG